MAHWEAIFTILTMTCMFLTSIATPPYFDSDASHYVRFPEDIPVGSVIKTFNVTDPDSGDNIRIIVTDPTTNDYFSFNQTLGNSIYVEVMLKQKLDRDRGTAKIELKFQAGDNEGNMIVLNVDLYISDVNDEKPVFQNEPYREEIPEDVPVNTTWTLISAKDMDNGYNALVTYAMKPESQSNTTAEEYAKTFSISNTTGVVHLNKALDYEANSYYQFNVTAQDMAPPFHRVYTILIIRVLDVQDTPPFFTGIPYRTTIKENVQIGTSVITVSARDGDPSVSNPVSFQIEEGDCSSFFIVSSTGLVETAKSLTRDEGEIKTKSGVCSFPVKAYELNDTLPQKGNTTTTTNITVIIEDVNNNAPEFENNTMVYKAEVQENTPNGVPITLKHPDQMRLHDKDQGENSEINITLNTPDFTISPTTIQDYGSLLIRVANQSVLNYEDRNNITFTVIATEKANSSHVATATVILKLIDMNDNNPLFVLKNYDFIIDENSPNRTMVGTVSATDLDSGEYGSVSYSLAGGNDRFIIGEKDGIIWTNCDNKTLDREKLDIYYLSVTASDGGGRSNATSVVIKLRDVNDNVPRFLRNEYAASIPENNTDYIDTPIIVLTANDADQENTNNSKVVYSVKRISEPSVKLMINDSTGAIHLRRAVDYETLGNEAGKVEVVVEARDGGRPRLSSTVTLTLDIQDINDNAPQFNQSIFEGDVFENETSTIYNHTYIVQVTATDADKTTRNNKFDYFIISGSFDKFSTDSSTGDVYIKPGATLDRETQDFYNITVYAIDHGSPPKTGTAVVSIDINDVNDVAPRFNLSSYNVSVKERETTRNAVTCFAYDEDEDHHLQLKITGIEALTEADETVNSSLVKTYFTIDPSNGSLSVDASADREVAQVIKLRITVADLRAATPDQTATTTLTVNLIDINDNYPKFESKNYTFSISENAQPQSIITTISATDADINRTITYDLISGPTPTGSFEINNRTGVLKKTGPLDRETNDAVDLYVTATDDGIPPKSSNLTVHIVISDFNDNAPKFNPHNTTYFIEEQQQADAFVIINATDADIGGNGDVTYSLTSAPPGSFKINNNTGEISTIKELDRESVSRYTLTIVATDKPQNPSEEKSNQTTIQIEVLDINDNAPKFDKPTYTATVREDADLNHPVLTVTANDIDKPDSNNSKVIYVMKSTQDSGLFKINMQTGVIQVNSTLKGKVGNYTLLVIAKDNGDPQLNGTTNVKVRITDVNLNKPVLVNIPPRNLVKTYECARINSTVYHFQATDADHGENARLNFTISKTEQNSSLDFFWIDSAKGVLHTKHELTDMGGGQFKLQLIVSDHGDPVLSSEPYAFNVEVLDVNDHPPEFKNNYTMSVPENHIMTVGTVKAEDKDKNSLSCYNVSDSTWSEYFNIQNDNSVGTIKTIKTLDRENPALTHENITSTIKLTIVVRDCSAPENKSDVCDNVTNSGYNGISQTAIVLITVEDEDDNSPVFNTKEISFGMRRNVRQGSTLNLQLKEGDYVTDQDTPANGRNRWVFGNYGKITISSDLQEKVQDQAGVTPCDDNMTHLFCVHRNGSVTSNFWFSEDMSGFFEVPVIVADGAGNDTASIKIYLIADSQVLIMTIFGKKAEISSQRHDILQLFSDITKHKFVYDDIADHKTDDGVVDSQRTDLFFHVVEPTTNRILSAADAQRLVDQFSVELGAVREKYLVTQIVSSVRSAPEKASSEKTIYILVAAVAVLSLTLCIIIYLSCSSVSRYRRKLKAATISSIDRDMEMKESVFEVPGSNQYSRQSNPLLNAKEPNPPQYDSLSLSSENSLDANAVDGPQPETIYDRMEEKEMTIDMYNDDELVASRADDPLAEVLRHHKLQRSTETLDRRSTDDSDDNAPIINEHVTSKEKVTIHGFENAAFDNLEHSEI